MENWGLVTYRETALLIDPKNSCSSSRQWVALVVGHELAHQWFGNLVTMEWWTHLWLNEGFASWIEYLCVDHCFPEYDIWTQFVSADYTRAQELDALDNSHPIEVSVGHPSEVDEIFDAISYSKGASVIRMLHDYIGDEDFRKGMNLYLTKFQEKNAATEDLWESLEKASGKPIAAVMNTWTKQMGFPLIYVEAEQQEEDKVLKLVQKKFCASGPYTGEDFPTWMVPISICTSDDPTCAKMQILMDKPELTLVLKDIKPDQWVKLNLGTVGFYRTQYSPDMLESLIPAIKDLSLPPVDRLGLQNDLFSLARAGIISTVEVLKVMEAFVNEPNYTVWSDLSCNLGILSTLLSHTDFYEEIQVFVKDVFSPIGERLGWDPKPGEGHLDALLRGLVLGKLGKAGHKATLEEARRRFKDHVEGKHVLSADLRSPVYVTVLKHGDSTTLDTMLKLHKQADMQEEKNRIERVLGAISQPELIQKVLTFALSEEVRPQDTVSVIGGVAGGSKQGRKAAWKFVRDNWEELYNRYQGGFLISRLIKLTVDGFANDKMAAEVKGLKPGKKSEVILSLNITKVLGNHSSSARKTRGRTTPGACVVLPVHVLIPLNNLILDSCVNFLNLVSSKLCLIDGGSLAASAELQALDIYKITEFLSLGIRVEFSKKPEDSSTGAGSPGSSTTCHGHTVRASVSLRSLLISEIREWIESSPEEKDLGVPVDGKLTRSRH
ncbi:PREDICTED: puromycin-sensitive aminopeptidase, partial [Tauraco erythrolophus]|uniref:puromycin-sensitive aminopeptidase n=1 Tax=Tauraco erythrolophus TaxID=121530 RepID=UPI000523BC97